jgi:hypothetical protein
VETSDHVQLHLLVLFIHSLPNPPLPPCSLFKRGPLGLVRAIVVVMKVQAIFPASQLESMGFFTHVRFDVVVQAISAIVFRLKLPESSDGSCER